MGNWNSQPDLVGALTAVLRFVPYVGVILAAAFPMALAAMDPGWWKLVETASVFIVGDPVIPYWASLSSPSCSATRRACVPIEHYLDEVAIPRSGLQRTTRSAAFSVASRSTNSARPSLNTFKLCRRPWNTGGSKRWPRLWPSREPSAGRSWSWAGAEVWIWLRRA